MGLVRNTLWATLGSWIQQGFSLLTMIVVARLLDPAAFGLIATAMLFVLLAQRVLLESVGYAVQRIEGHDATVFDAAFVLSVAAGVVMGGMMAFGAPFLAAWFGEPMLAPVLLALAPMPLIDALATVHLSLLRRDMQFKTLAMRTLWSNLVSGAVGIVLAWTGAGVWSLIVQQLIAAGGGLLAAWLASPWRPRRAWRSQDFRSLIVFGAPMIGNAVVFVLSNRLDVMALAGASNATVTGTYSLAKRLVRAVTDLVVSGAMSVSLAALSGATRSSHQRATFVQAKLRLISFIAYPLYAGLGALAADLVPTLLGAQWSGAVAPLQWLAAFGVLQVPLLIATNVLVADGRSQDLLLFNVVSLASLALLIVLLADRGAVGVAAAFVGQAVAGLPLLLHLVQKRTGIAARSFAVALGPAWLTIAAMVAAMLAVRGWMATNAPWTRLAACAAVGGAVYLAVGWLLMRSQMRDLSQLIRGKTGRIAT